MAQETLWERVPYHGTLPLGPSQEAAVLMGQRLHLNWRTRGGK